LGRGISENIREVYSFIAANYTPGDEIILIGFSRGAFTARSVAGMIKDIGLLTRDGMSYYYPIFKDQENFRNQNYTDPFPEIPFPRKPKGSDAAMEYKQRLEQVVSHLPLVLSISDSFQGGLTRIADPDGSIIRVRAVAVWETVGALGIPQIAILAKLGLPHCKPGSWSNIPSLIFLEPWSLYSLLVFPFDAELIGASVPSGHFYLLPLMPESRILTPRF
jgi:hypothetical protein